MNYGCDFYCFVGPEIRNNYVNVLGKVLTKEEFLFRTFVSGLVTGFRYLVMSRDDPKKYEVSLTYHS